MRKGFIEIETNQRPSAGGAESRFRPAETDSPPARPLVARCQGVPWKDGWRRCWCGHAPIDPRSLGEEKAAKIAAAIAAGDRAKLDDLIKRLLPKGCTRCKLGVWRVDHPARPKLTGPPWPLGPPGAKDKHGQDVEIVYTGEWWPMARADQDKEEGDWGLTETVLAARCQEQREKARAILEATGRKRHKRRPPKALSLEELLNRRAVRKARRRFETRGLRPD